MQTGRRRSRPSGQEQLFLLLLTAAVVSYALSRFLDIHFFALPATVLLAPRNLIQGSVQTLAALRRDNQRLSERCVQQELELGFWRGQAARQDSFGARFRLLRATVTGRDPQTLVRTLIVDRGLLNGVRPNMVAITETGVVGKVLEVGVNLAFVGTLLNPRVKLAALDQRSRVNGVVGFKEGGLLGLDYVLHDWDVLLGDTIVTSGIGGVFPRGLRIGVVVRTDSSLRGLFRSISVRPLVNVAALEQLYLIEPADWVRIERQQEEEAAALRRSRAIELERLLEESRIELHGTPARGERQE